MPSPTFMKTHNQFFLLAQPILQYVGLVLHSTQPRTITEKAVVLTGYFILLLMQTVSVGIQRCDHVCYVMLECISMLSI